MYVGVRVLFDGGEEVVVIVVLVDRLDKIAVAVVLGRVPLQDVPAIAGMLDSLEAAC